MTPETIRMLLGLLDQVTIPGSAPDAVEQATMVVNARRELTDALPALDDDDGELSRQGGVD